MPPQGPSASYSPPRAQLLAPAPSAMCHAILDSKDLYLLPFQLLLPKYLPPTPCFLFSSSVWVQTPTTALALTAPGWALCSLLFALGALLQGPPSGHPAKTGGAALGDGLASGCPCGTSPHAAPLASGSPPLSSLAIPPHLLDASSARDPLMWAPILTPLSPLSWCFCWFVCVCLRVHTGRRGGSRPLRSPL